MHGVSYFFQFFSYVERTTWGVPHYCWDLQPHS